MLDVATVYLPSVYLLVGTIFILMGLVPSVVTAAIPSKYGIKLAEDGRLEHDLRKAALGYILMCGLSLTCLAALSWNGRVEPSDILDIGIPALVLTRIAIHFVTTVWARSTSEGDKAGVSHS
jgi:MFS family permease